MRPDRHYLTTLSRKYSEVCKSTIVSPESGETLYIGKVVLTNRSGGATDVGFGFRHTNSMWEAGQITAASTPDYSDDTTDAQDAGTNDFALFTTTNNDGFLVQSIEPFNLIGIDLSTAASGGSPVYEYTYYDGTNMTALTLIDTPDYTDTTNDQHILFEVPNNWAKGSTAAVGADSDKYAVQVRATTASSGAGGLAAELWIASLTDLQVEIANNFALVEDFGSGEMAIPHGNGFVAYFETASANNLVEVHYRSSK